MRIVVLEGSPNRHGSSNMLADEFIRGAKEAGHTIKVIDAAHTDLHPCTGCVCCGYEGPCVQKDDMEQFGKEIPEAYEIRASVRRVECGRMDVRRSGGAL